jgi:hypothetical protein
MYGLYLWLVEVDTHFRVIPRLHTIKKKHEFLEGEYTIIYNCEDVASNTQHREKVKKLHHRDSRKNASTTNSNNHHHLDAVMADGEVDEDVVLGESLDEFFGMSSRGDSQTIENSPLFLNVITNLGQHILGARDDDLITFKFKLDYVDKKGCATIPSKELNPTVKFVCHINEEDHQHQERHRNTREITCNFVGSNQASWTFFGFNLEYYFAHFHGFYSRSNFEVEV